MSRCFLYPPPGYRGDKKGSLIESIKLQKDKEKAKEERRKERKKEKKGKKRKLEVHTIDEFGQGKLIKEQSQKLEKQISTLKDKYNHRHGDDESSDVTEEHDQPVCVPKPSYSSENSQNSDKRRRHESPANSIKADGSVLKIRLSSFKKKEPNAIDRDDMGPSTSGRTDSFGQNDFGFGQRLVKEQPCTSSFNTGICVPGTIPMEKQPSLKFVDSGIHVPTPIPVEKQRSLKFVDSRLSIQDPAVSKPSTSKASKSTSKASKAELLYKSLLESWAPPAQVNNDDDDQDWLFQKRSRIVEKSETSVNVLCNLDSNLWPRAQFLPSFDVYALPYTVPF